MQGIIDLQDKIKREGTLTGEEFDLQSRQQPKRALMELPILGQSPMFVRPESLVREPHQR
jgi:hypothetical protein